MSQNRLGRPPVVSVVKPVTASRIGGALLVLAAGAIHLWLYFDFFHRVHVIGVLFIANAAAAAVIGAGLLLSGSPWLLAAGTGYAVATLTAFFVSVYHGLFGYVESLTGAWQLAAGGVEIATIVVLAPTLVLTLRDEARRVDGYGMRRHKKTSCAGAS
jgi:hypothetical protein